jgi:phage gp36-like protein
MPYATQQNMIDRFGSKELIELTDRANIGVIDATVLGNVLADADAEINTYLTGRYALPLATTPPVLTKFACDVARYQLYDVRASEQVKARYDDAIKFFKLLANGGISLGLDSLLTTPVADAGGIGIKANVRKFSMGTSGAPGTLDDY